MSADSAASTHSTAHLAFAAHHLQACLENAVSFFFSWAHQHQQQHQQQEQQQQQQQQQQQHQDSVCE
ncbi:hypothetical protein ACSSS7_001623 [Eimeria intestinalis]